MFFFFFIKFQLRYTRKENYRELVTVIFFFGIVRQSEWRYGYEVDNKALHDRIIFSYVAIDIAVYANVVDVTAARTSNDMAGRHCGTAKDDDIVAGVAVVVTEVPS